MTDKEIIDNYIEEQGFFKSDTPDDIRRAFDDILNDGIVSSKSAIDIIASIVSAIRNEYGD